MQISEYLREVVIPSVNAANWYEGVTPSAGELIKKTLNLILLVVVVAAVIFIMFAGMQYVTSQGDPTKAKGAMAGITNAIIGLIVTFAAYAIVQLVMTQLGFDAIKDLPT